MGEVFIGLGSNQNNPIQQLHKALQAIDKITSSALVCYSKYYKNPPLGSQQQADYVNAVAHMDTDLSALSLLHHLQAIELQHGRVRSGERWGPRPLDLDLLLFGEQVINSSVLTVPHPEIAHRAFVLYPLFEIAPDIIIPGLGAIADLLWHVDARQLTVVT